MTQEFKVPELGENIETGTVVKVFIADGGAVARDQPVVELETGKAVVEIPSDQDGTVERVNVKEGDEVRVGQVLFTIREEAAPKGTNSQPEQAEPAAPAPAPESARPSKISPSSLPAAPSVRRLARERGVNLASIKGTGPNGRILATDVQAPAKEAAAPPRTEPDKWGPVERKSMSQVRLMTARRMSRAWATVPHVTQMGKADVTEIGKLRLHYKDETEKAGVKLSLTVILIKAVAGALKAFPPFNASVDMERHEIVFKHYCHIGVAADTPRGLVVPVIRDVERKNLVELAGELKSLTDKARNGKLAPADMEGGSFTITNAGALGGDTFIPIVNWPEVAILGVARTRIEPVFLNGAFEPREMLPLALSYDHRVIDGADGVRFMSWLVAALEDPVSLLWKG